MKHAYHWSGRSKGGRENGLVGDRGAAVVTRRTAVGLREEQRWLCQEAWWKAEREALHREIPDLKRRLKEREKLVILGNQSAFISGSFEPTGTGAPNAVETKIEKHLDICGKEGVNVNEVPYNGVPSTV